MVSLLGFIGLIGFIGLGSGARELPTFCNKQHAFHSVEVPFHNVSHDFIAHLSATRLSICTTHCQPIAVLVQELSKFFCAFAVSANKFKDIDNHAC